MADAPAFGIALFLLVAIVLIIIAIFVYMLVWKPSQPAPSCSSNLNCGNGQVCSNGACTEIICSSNNDCGGNGNCVNSYCLYNSCTNGQECAQDEACVNGQCTKINQSCNSSSDCKVKFCSNNQCVQCLQNSDCPTGQGCLSGACRFPTPETVAPTGSVVIPVVAPGNLLAPSAVMCNSAACGQTPTPCSADQPCPSGCGFCASGFCKCTPGQLYESCVSNNDCASGVCSASLKICIGSHGQCARNYDGTDPNNPNNCTINSPYCVDGLCTASSLGAPCAFGPGMSTPADICRNPGALGSNLKATADSAGYNCVNGFCQQEAGLLNQQCTSGSCEVFSSNNLVCVNTTGQLRCQVGTT
jgi:Cys-rich repeat protein